MGFFASRWIEKHGAASEKAALTTITNGLSGPSTSESEGAGTVKSKWVSPIAPLILSDPTVWSRRPTFDHTSRATQPVAQLANGGRLTLPVSTTPDFLDSPVTLHIMLTGRFFQFARKPKDVQINPSQANQNPANGAPNGYNPQLRHQKSLTGVLAHGGYGTWSGPPPPLSPAVSTSPSTLALETNNSASVYSYNLPSGPSRDQILKRAAERGPTDTVTSVPHFYFLAPPFPSTPTPLPPSQKNSEATFARFEWLEGVNRYFSSLLWTAELRTPWWRYLVGFSRASLGIGW